MSIGTLIFVLVIAILVIYFLGFTIFLWCIPLTIVIIIIAFLYPVFRDEKKIPNMDNLHKDIWRKYLKWEAKLFRWIDDRF